TRCEESISPNACVIIDDKPYFLTVEELLKSSTENTKELLRIELEIKKRELEEKWFFASLEKIFIENRIYREIEEAESFEAVIQIIDEALREYVTTPSDEAFSNKKDKRIKLIRDIEEDDIVRLTEIRIKRISKYNKFKADERIQQIEADLEQVKHDLAHLTEFAIAYFEDLLKKYGKGRERRTEITTFDSIQATQVVANNAKLYANLKDGFIGHSLKKGEGEYICDCSDIDNIIVFRKDGKFMVSRIEGKKFVGKNIIHVDVWKKGDERTTYNMAYLDAASGRTYVKRFNVSAITRDREYDLTKGSKGSKTTYFTTNPNGESEIIQVQLTQSSTAKIKQFDFDFGELAIKGRGANGNILTRYPVRKITQKEVGQSTLGALEIYMDEVSGRLNTDKRGIHLGDFDTGDQILVIYKDGSYELTDFELTNRYEPKEIIKIGKLDPAQAISAVYYDGNRGSTMVKRFLIETSTQGQRFSFITDHRSSKLYFATFTPKPRIKYSMRVKGQKMEGELDLADFIDVKGWKALGNKLSEHKLSKVEEVQIQVGENGQTELTWNLGNTD
ncbi:MAG: DNA gyrase/topoisomerase IV subunit A, partial [Bacteroidota bacterium]